MTNSCQVECVRGCSSVVERSLRMREARGSTPRISTLFYSFFFFWFIWFLNFYFRFVFSSRYLYQSPTLLRYTNFKRTFRFFMLYFRSAEVGAIRRTHHTAVASLHVPLPLYRRFSELQPVSIMEKHLLIASASAITASALTVIAYRYLSKRHEASENVYETEKLIGEYLIFHYGTEDELLPYGFGPKDSLEFPSRCALECIKHAEVSL